MVSGFIDWLDIWFFPGVMFDRFRRCSDRRAAPKLLSDWVGSGSGF
jgi:hypothetical protein